MQILWSRKANFEPQGIVLSKEGLHWNVVYRHPTKHSHARSGLAGWLLIGKRWGKRNRHVSPCFLHVSPRSALSQQHLATLGTWQSRHHSCQIIGPESGRFCGTVKIKEETCSPSTMKMLAWAEGEHRSIGEHLWNMWNPVREYSDVRGIKHIQQSPLIFHWLLNFTTWEGGTKASPYAIPSSVSFTALVTAQFTLHTVHLTLHTLLYTWHSTLYTC